MMTVKCVQDKDWCEAAVVVRGLGCDIIKREKVETLVTETAKGPMCTSITLHSQLSCCPNIRKSAVSVVISLW